jgi:CubicO group peptidase (beta-lactamase class C family)
MKQNFFEIVGWKTPGYAMAVIKDGRIVLMETAGLADLDKQTPITTKTAFRLASLSKQFTAMAMMILAERKKLSLENKLTDFFFDYPEYGKQVTVRQLLTHTGGIPDHEKPLYQLIKQRKNIRGYDRKPRYSEPTIYDALEILKNQPIPLFRPGNRYKYSDAGYVLLALIIEKVSGLSYREFLTGNIFSPLAMSCSDVLDQTKPKIKNRATGYKASRCRDNKFEVFDYDPLNYIVGDEGVYSSIEDLIKWNRAWEEEILVGRKSLTEAMTPVKLTNGNFGAGFSWLFGKFNGDRVIYQDGVWVGFRNILLKIPAGGVTVIILSNRSDLDTEAKRISVAYRAVQKFF